MVFLIRKVIFSSTSTSTLVRLSSFLGRRRFTSTSTGTQASPKIPLINTKKRYGYHQYQQLKMINNPLVWIDLEMTGLDINNDHIIEIACLITDGDLNLVAEGPDLIIHQSKQVMDNMNEWCVKHHGESGLTAAVLNSSISVQEAESQVLKFIQQHIPEKTTGILAGNSVHMDKFFLMKEMPNIVEHLHYRLVDVSTIKELTRRWYPDVLEKAPPKKMSHRALDDIRESIEELKFYRKSVFKN